MNDDVRTTDFRKTFSKGDTTKLCFESNETTEYNNDTIPSYRIDDLPEGYIEALLKKTESTEKESDSFMNKLNLNQVEVSLTI